MDPPACGREHARAALSSLAELYLKGLEHSAEAMQVAMGGPPSLIEKLFDRPMFTTVNGYAYMRGNMNLRWWVPLFLVSAIVMGVTRMLRGAGINYWREEVLPSYLSATWYWKGIDHIAGSDEELLRGVRELAKADAIYWFACTLTVGTAKVADDLLNRFLATAAPGRGLTSALFLRGFPSIMLEAEVELESIAARIRGSNELRTLVAATPARRLPAVLAGEQRGGDIVKEIHHYLDRYGHQIYNLDFAEPTQADDALPVLLNMKALVERAGAGAGARQAEMARERDDLARKTALTLTPLRRRLFLWLLYLAQRFGPCREDALFYVGAAWPTLRRLALELGRRLAEAGSLEMGEDVFFLESEELAAAITGRATVQARPDLMRLACKRLHPPASLPPEYRWKLGPTDLSERMSQRLNEPNGSTLRGFALSPGQVTAPASVILSPSDFDQMEPDTILVCPTTTPAWTPLFAQARGLVTDIGGVLAHGSIIAREFGIPAVMGTGIATQRIVSGQLLTVDGDAGVVILSASNPVTAGGE